MKNNLDNIKFTSQYGQDRYCYNQFFKNKTTGTFLEIGCIDGIKFSNTFAFEQLGWSGLCVEPSENNFKHLVKNRNCICEKYAVGVESGKKVQFLDIYGYGEGLSGVIEKYDTRHVSRIQREIQNAANSGHSVIEVETININKLLTKHNLHNIDICSIDTEGGEEDIVESIDFNINKIDILIVENNYKTNRVKNYLESVSYAFICSMGSDDIYKFT
jgi:FkbM family methyltransferase